ncbi:MAG: hypothetical protein WCT49_05045 [Candidatus Paceibacterota bacterium]|jgi:hypothetical protein|nr:hypothetical protein [Candidatus Paceibacterota bacterium]
MEPKKILQSEITKRVLKHIAMAAIALFIFQAGVVVGFKKAEFSGRLGDNYYRTFGERGNFRGMPPIFGTQRMDPSNAHGTIGKIASIALPKIIVADRDGVEKTISVNDKTDVRRFRDSIKPSDLKVGDFITVIGKPTDAGEINAELIRVMPALPTQNATATTSTPSKN